MTYFSDLNNLPPTSKKLECAIFQWSSGGLGNACPLVLIDHNWTTAPVLTSGSDGLTLPAGYYMSTAYVYATRTVASHNCQFQFFVNSVAVGVPGNTDVYLNYAHTDQADVEFEVTSSDTLELKITNREALIPTITTESRLVVWRVAS